MHCPDCGTKMTIEVEKHIEREVEYWGERCPNCEKGWVISYDLKSAKLTLEEVEVVNT